MNWDQLGPWWVEELDGDPAYDEEVQPLLLDLLSPRPGDLCLDIGCGQGRLMAAIHAAGSVAIGCDLNAFLLSRARSEGPVVRAELPDLGWIKGAPFDRACVSLVLEHLRDELEFFRQTAKVVRQGGVLALVINHPIWTSPESSPMEDPDGETLWRPGIYFGQGHSDEPAGEGSVRFYHRTLAALLNSASSAGWDLDRLEERGVSEAQVGRASDLAGQEHIPRILGARWRRR